MTLNEADVLGLRLEPSGAWCDLLLHVVALPESGPIDPDARRILRLSADARLIRAGLQEHVADAQRHALRVRDNDFYLPHERGGWANRRHLRWCATISTGDS